MSSLVPAVYGALVPRHSPRVHGLDVEVFGAGDDLRVHLRGEAGFAEAGKLEVSLLPLSAQRPASVTFDFSKLRYISSLGLAALIRYHRCAVRNGVRVCLADNLQPMVHELFQTTGVLRLFEASETA
jgi:anti-anti-sigma factor